MTRKQAEKIANAIRLVAERDRSAWTMTNITTMEVAAVLKKPAYEVESALASDASAVWSCLPIGWRFGIRGTGIAVSRQPREG